jgi:hypothetical protein
MQKKTKLAIETKKIKIGTQNIFYFSLKDKIENKKQFTKRIKK